MLAFYAEKAADIEKELRDLERELPQLKPGQLESVEDEQVLMHTNWALLQAPCSSCRSQIAVWADATCLAVQHAAAAWHEMVKAGRLRCTLWPQGISTPHALLHGMSLFGRCCAAVFAAMHAS